MAIQQNGWVEMTTIGWSSMAPMAPLPLLPRCRLDLRDIRVISKQGGTIDDSTLVDGLVFDQKAATVRCLGLQLSFS
jgi:hypothetical protein